MNSRAAQFAGSGIAPRPERQENVTGDLNAINEKHRRIVVGLIFVVYLLLIFEGALRKWVAPHLGKQLFFIRDPFVLAIYIMVLARRTRLRSGFLEIGCLFAFGGLVMLIAQRVSEPWDSMSAVLSGYGWRNYFFNLPLAFIIGRYLDLRDLGRVMHATALISVPIAALVIVQFNSPPFAPINAGLGETKDEIYYQANLLPGGFVRTSGTFTSSLGQTAFTASAVAMTISLWLGRPHGSRSLRAYFLLACATVGPLICLSLSGSRGVLIWSGLIVVVGIGGLCCGPGEMGFKGILITSILLLFGALIPPVLFPKATASFTERWTDAGDLERREYGSGGIFARALYEVFSFHLLLADTPAQGYGLGSAGNAAWNLGTRNQAITFTNLEQIAAAESDWGRHILELGPFFGSLFILFRVAFVIWLAKGALMATIRSGHPLPWLLFAFIGVILFNGQITANGTENGYAWLFTGLCLAAVNGANRFNHQISYHAVAISRAKVYAGKHSPQPTSTVVSRRIFQPRTDGVLRSLVAERKSR